MKFCSIFLINLILKISILDGKFNFRVTRIECESSNKTVTSYNCYLKAYNRRSPVFNIELFLIRNNEDCKTSLYQSYKLNRDDEYKLLFKFENLEPCKIWRGVSGTPFLNQLFDWVISVNRKIPLLCNTTGQINMNNVSVPDSPFLKLFPSAYYRFNGLIFDDIDNNVFNITFYVTLSK